MKNANITNVKWGEIYLCDLGSNKGSVQSGKRPVLVLQNNIGNNNGPTTVVATISSVLKKLNQPTHILLDTSCGLREDSIVMLEQIRTVDKEKELLEYIGEVRDEKTIYAIKQGILTEFGLIKRPQPRRTGLILTLCPKCRAEFMSVPENIVRRVDPLQVDKERCDKCQTSFGYDAETAPILERIARSIYDGTASETGRPERVSEKVIYREMGFPGHRLENLPLCKAVFDRYSESYEENWARRIVWGYSKLKANNAPFYWSDIRAITGVKKKNIEKVIPHIRKYTNKKTAEAIINLVGGA